GDAVRAGGIGALEGLRVAEGGRRLTDLQRRREVFGRTGLPTEARDWLSQSLGLPIQWLPRGPGASRTLARGAPPRVFFHEAGLDRSAGDLVDALSRPLPALARAPRELADALIGSARGAMATRPRARHALASP